MVTAQSFGTLQGGREVTAYTLENGPVRARVLDFGAVLADLFVPDRDGRMDNVVLGYDRAEKYAENPCFFGATAGIVCNRTGGAVMEIDGREYHMPANEGRNNLHTDFDRGVHKRFWKALPGRDFVMFTLSLSDGEFGLPGERHLTVTYSVTEAGTLRIHYHGTSDKKTPFNLTNHSYFNLEGHASGSVDSTWIRLFCSHFTPINEEMLPTGEIRSIRGTPFDFAVPKKIGDGLSSKDPQILLAGGYDHNFVIDEYREGAMHHAASAWSDRSGRALDVYTDLPGVQFYTANTTQEEGREGIRYGNRSAFCLETQYFPDSVHHADFPQYIFGQDTVYDSVTEYHFSVR